MTGPEQPAAGSRTEQLRALEHEVGVLVRRVRRVVGERARAVHPQLQPASYLLLAHLAESGPVRASELVGTFDVDKGAVSRQVQHLLDLGLVDRVPDPADGRASLVSITPEAVRRLEDVAADRRRAFGERLAGWDEEELAGLVAVLSRYNDTLGGPTE